MPPFLRHLFAEEDRLDRTLRLAGEAVGAFVGMAGALQVSIEERIAAPRSDVRLHRNGTLPIENRGTGRKVVEVRSLLPDPVPGMQIDLLELEPGGKMFGIPHSPGTREFLVCERGRLTLQAGGERYELSFGDVVSYQGDQPHSYWNEGRVTAVGFSVVAITPPGLRGATEGAVPATYSSRPLTAQRVPLRTRSSLFLDAVNRTNVRFTLSARGEPHERALHFVRTR